MYRPDIDGLRAVAVAAVVAYHAFPGILHGGFIGVDVFFVISGFLISSILFESLEAGTFSFRQFYARRILRLFPALALMLAAVLAAGWLILLPQEYAQLGHHAAAGGAFVVNFVLWSESGYFDAAAHLKPLLHLWSLGVEEQFYLVWPVLLFVAHRLKIRQAVVVVAVGFASFAVCLWASSARPEQAFYAPWTRMWELSAGAALALAGGRGVGHKFFIGLRPLRDAASVAGLAMIAASFVLVDQSRAFPGWWAVMPVLGACFLIAAGPSALVNRLLLSKRPMVAVGLISYPLYLWHWPLLSFVFLTMDGSSTSGRAARVAAVAISILLSALTYALVERRFRIGRPSWRKVALASASIAIAAGSGAGLAAAGGIVSRFPSDVLRLTEEFDREALRRAYRSDTCFFDARRIARGDFTESCVEREPAAQPLVLLWGDSHAAHLYPGLARPREDRSFRLAQFTAQACPPDAAPAAYRDGCSDMNAAVRDAVTRLRPGTAILAARWQKAQDMRGSLVETVAFLKRNGTARVIVVGPPPRWDPSIRLVLFRLYRSLGRVPDRLEPQSASFAALTSTDRDLRAAAREAGAEYVSLIEMLCESNTCLVRVGPQLPDDLIAVDYDHFTPAASRYVVSRLTAGLNLP